MSTEADYQMPRAVRNRRQNNQPVLGFGVASTNTRTNHLDLELPHLFKKVYGRDLKTGDQVWVSFLNDDVSGYVYARIIRITSKGQIFYEAKCLGFTVKGSVGRKYAHHEFFEPISMKQVGDYWEQNSDARIYPNFKQS